MIYMKNNLTPSCLAGLGLVLSALPLAADPLASGFRNPPDSAKAQTWWHWMNGNISKAGITADLEAMKQIGLGGATIVNVDSGIPAGQVPFMSPQWREHFKFAVQEAHRLGLELCVENCAGWSSSGGPWNTVENSMQRVTTSEVRVKGPTHFQAKLAQPPTTRDFYRDIAVLAFPAPAEEAVRMVDAAPVTTISGKDQPGSKLTDGDPKTTVSVPAPEKGQPQYFQLEFPKPFAARTITLVGGKGINLTAGKIIASDDGKKFRTLKTFSFGRRDAATRAISFGAQPVVARFWRVEFTTADPTVKSIALADIDLSPRLTIENIQVKAGFDVGGVAPSPVSNDDAVAGTVPCKEVVDLTTKMAADGTLNWQAPAGEWVIMRLGHTSTGAINHPAPESGRGLECDKFSKSALDAHWNGFMQKVLDDVGPLAGKALNSSLIDSYEVGGQNWNKDFRAEFKQRCGYDLLKFLPAFTGRTMDSPAASERFLWDVRRTISELFAENYFGYFAKLCKDHGLSNAVEPYTGPFEPLQCGAPADVVMGEFWAGSKGHSSIKLAASIAHIYGKTFVGAESFTAKPEAGRWTNDPNSLKTLGDLMYCQGLNRYIFHRYAMQPWTNRFPGMTMGQWGFHFERTLTWWSQGKAWIDYIAHCQFMLQQGRAVADVAYFTGENANVNLRVGKPALPAGFDYDALNTDVLLHGASVKSGRLTLASGASYALLILPPDDVTLTPPMLQRIGELVRAGATVLGPRPLRAPGLTGYPQCDAQVAKLAAELWGKCDGAKVTHNTVGQGRIVWGQEPADILAAQKLLPDFEFQGGSRNTQLAYTHRVAGDADIYFVSNQQTEFASADCKFRVKGKVPELWNPETGTITKAAVWHEQDGRTIVNLAFQPAGSVFVVFREPAGTTDHIAALTATTPTAKPQLPTLAITRARYEAEDGSAGKDVTAQLASLVKDGSLSVKADNSLFGEAAALHVKQLRVEFVLDGKTEQRIVKEHGLLAISGTETTLPPSYEILTDADGRISVSASAPGTLEGKTANGKTVRVEIPAVPAPVEVAGPWDLSFPPNWGAPPRVTMPALISWTAHTEPGVRYFSGTATYLKTVEIPAERLGPGRDLWLDLGAVKNFAEVSVNGKQLGVLWKPPFRVNLTAAAKPGTNTLEIKITNLWPNRLIGDEQLPPDCEWNGMRLKEWPQWLLDGKPSPTGRLTFTTWHHWKKDDALLDSGLLGPVILSSSVTVPLK